MAVARELTSYVMRWSLALAAALSAQGAMANAEVLRLLQREVAVKTTLLAAAEKECTAREQAALPARLTTENLQALGLPRHDLGLAVGYLVQRNGYACSQAALAELLHAALALERTQKVLGQTPSQISGNLVDTVFPGPSYYKMAMAFSKLPEESRIPLEHLIGSEPLDMRAVLQRLPAN
ncbi:hypothetical protein [Pseudomonas paralcaligenes]|uniref:hypothetical protein n=1 Tax=Pseudomonas paralcaligenes TaxID=2772558 RepID=UPI001C81A1E3|nr:hypothetical protein [Pseudomonas paralcaligenes]